MGQTESAESHTEDQDDQLASRVDMEPNKILTGGAVGAASLKSAIIQPAPSPASVLNPAHNTADRPGPSPSDRTNLKRSHDEMEHAASALGRAHSPPRLSRTFRRDPDVLPESPPSHPWSSRQQSRSLRGQHRSPPTSGIRPSHRRIDRYIPVHSDAGAEHQRVEFQHHELERRRSSGASRSSPDHKYRQSPEPFRRPPLPVKRQASASSLLDTAAAGSKSSPPRETNRSTPLFKNRTWTATNLQPTESFDKRIDSRRSMKTTSNITATPRSGINDAPTPALTPVATTQPGSPPLPEATTNGDTTSASVSRVDFNGLTGVPIGPAKPTSSLPSPNVLTSPPSRPSGQRLLSLRPVQPSVHLSPHVLITAASFPPNPKQIRHLQGVVRRFKPKDVLVDNAGYYIVFPDNPVGHDSLDQCARTCDGFMLFNSYQMVAQAHHVYPDDVNAVTIGHDHRSSNHNHREDDAGEKGFNDFSDISLFNDQDQSRDIKRKSSPLQIPIRQDNNDAASSTSGRTNSSDMSAYRQKKCHACREPSLQDHDPLTGCSTCPRRFHRRCHSGLATLEGPNEDQWQCRRCIKKNIHPPTTTRSPPLEPAGEVASALPNGEPAAKHRRLDKPEVLLTTEIAPQESTTVESAMQLAEPKARLASSIQISTLHDPGIRTDLHQACDISNATRERTPQPTSEDEASQLVESSFLPSVQPSSVQSYAVVRRLNDVLSRRSVPQTNRSQAQPAPQAGGLSPVKCQQVGSVQVNLSRADEAANTEHTSVDRSQTKNGATKVTEVPESPLETSRDPRLHRHRQHTAPMLHEETVVRSDIASASPVDSVIQEGKNRAPTVPSMGKAKRTKPTLVTPTCVKCKRKFGRSASSSTELCRQCTDLLKTQPPLLTSPNVSLFKDSQQPSAQLNAPGLEENTLAVRLSLPAQPSAQRQESTEAHRSTFEANGGMKMAQEVPGDQPTSELCVDCHKHAKNCTHSPRSEKTDGSKNRDELTQNDPLDFWGTQKTNVTSSHTPEITRRSIEKHHGQNASTSSVLPHKAGHAQRLIEAVSVEVSPISSLSPCPPSEDEESHVQLSTDRGVHAGEKRKTTKKKHRESATNVEGLGDSFERPKKTYQRLIMMALCDAVGHRLQKRSIVQWIVKNVPGYTRKEGNWESGISATLSMNYGDKGLKLWQKIETLQKGEACWYEMAPEDVARAEHWDPVLKQPVSPKGLNDRAFEVVAIESTVRATSRSGPQDMEKTSRHPPEKAAIDPDDTATEESGHQATLPSANDTPEELAAYKADRAMSLTKARAAEAAICEQNLAADEEPSTDDKDDESMDIDNLPSNAPHDTHMQGTSIIGAIPPNGDPGVSGATAKFDIVQGHHDEHDDSSDTEPLSMLMRRRRSKQSVAPPASMQATATQLKRTSLSEGAVTTSARSEGATNLAQAQVKYLPNGPAALPKTRGSAKAPVVMHAKLALFSHAFSVRSLFEEWPEYRPSTQLDREVKTFEMQQRPTRKQMFGKPAMYSRLASNDQARPSKILANDQRKSSSLRSPAKRVDGTPKHSNRSDFTLDLGEAVKRFDDLSDFLGLPDKPMAIVHNQQLAFRDGTRDEHGELPRAKVYYKTGYA